MEVTKECNICKTTCRATDIQCNTCNFYSINGIANSFINKQEISTYVNSTIIPYRNQYKIIKRLKLDIKNQAIYIQDQHDKINKNKDKIEILEDELKSVKNSNASYKKIIGNQETAIENILRKLDKLEKGQAVAQQKQKVRKGDTITFGNIQWQVLKIEGYKALIISKNIVEMSRPYNNEHVATTWETSDMRKYLNDEFYNKLRKEDKEKIVTTTVVTANNPWYSLGKGGNVTQDKIFLLSIEEVLEYFGDSGQLISRPQKRSYEIWLTEDLKRFFRERLNYDLDITLTSVIDDKYNESRIGKSNKDVAVWWWLRSAGDDPYGAVVVRRGGSLRVGGVNVNRGGAGSSSGGVRPALWLNI